MNDLELLALADAVASRAYAPYSKFHVGCAVLARDGRVIEGVNVENAAYPLGVCAERTAFSRAIVEGYRPGDFEVSASTAQPTLKLEYGAYARSAAASAAASSSASESGALIRMPGRGRG